MEYRRLGHSGLQVPVLAFGTATFGGGNEFFKAWGDTDVAGAKRLVDVCLDNGMNFFDTANMYSNGASEEILAAALEGRRNQVLLSTKATFPMGEGPNDFGSGRRHLTEALEASLRRLKTDHVDIYHMHGFDSFTPVEETLQTLDDFVRSGKVRYIAASNFSGWHLMKSLSASEKHGWNRYVGHQAYYSLLSREYEWELMPLAQDQGVGTIVWSPLASSLLTGKVRRGQAAPKDSRLSQINFIPHEEEHLFRIVDELDAIAKVREKSIPQVALNWLLRRPTITSIVVGARNEAQLKANMGALGWKLSEAEVARLDKASEKVKTYPYWHQHQNPNLIPPIRGYSQ